MQRLSLWDHFGICDVYLRSIESSFCIIDCLATFGYSPGYSTTYTRKFLERKHYVNYTYRGYIRVKLIMIMINLTKEIYFVVIILYKLYHDLGWAMHISVVFVPGKNAYPNHPSMQKL